MRRISVNEFLSYRNQNIPIIDSRSPGEFAQGNIFHSINLPLFTDQERAIIGTEYKQVGKTEAIDLGIEIIGPKLKFFKDFIRNNIKQENLILYCWRGGMRSASMAWLFELLGKKVHVIEGGYKAYRNYIIEYLNKVELILIVLGGKTGTGKTHVLHSLENLGEQILDLENLADHKGSAFGSIGSIKEVGTEEFENLIFERLNQLDLKKRIWIENESRGVGIAQIPDNIWTQMRSSMVVQIEMSTDNRIKNLLEDYSPENSQELIHSFEKIRKRLGHENTDKAIQFIQETNYKEAARIALKYYDKTYEYGISIRDQNKVITFSYEDYNSMEIAKDINKKIETWNQ